MNILLDPYVLAIPEENARIQTYLDDLYLWTTAVIRKEHHYWTSQCVVEALCGAGCYPSLWNLRPLERYISEDKPYNICTLFTACERQLTTPPLLDELFDNPIILYEDEGIIVIPPQIESRLPENVASALKATLALSAVGKHLSAHSVFGTLLFATAPDSFPEKQLEVFFVAQNLETEEPQEITDSFDIVFTPEEVDGLEGLLAHWEDTQWALRWTYQALKQVGNLNDAPRSLPRITAGRKFNESIDKLHLDKDVGLMEDLFKAVILAAVGKKTRFQKAEGNDHHPLRGDKERQIEREDGGLAWRLHLQRNYRLHYWLLPNGDFELSCVCVHDDYKIV